jgi:hypothetical protein
VAARIGRLRYHAPMRACSGTAVVIALAMGACAGHHRLEAVKRLSEGSKALFAKYRQFMTEGQHAFGSVQVVIVNGVVTAVQREGGQ